MDQDLKFSEVSKETPYRLHAHFPIIVRTVNRLVAMAAGKASAKEMMIYGSRVLADMSDDVSLQFKDISKLLEERIVEHFAIKGSVEGDPNENEKRNFPKVENLRGTRILLVDPNVANRDTMRILLAQKGGKVFEAKSSDEALWLVQEVDPDLIITELEIDMMSGIEICRRIKSEAKNVDLPIIIVSGIGNRTDGVEAFSSGAVDFLVRPFNVGEVLARLSHHIDIMRLSQFRKSYINDLVEANKTKDRNFRGASHDLRNSLTGIKTLIGFLLDATHRLDGEDAKDLLLAIEEASDSGLRLIEDLLNVSVPCGVERNLNCERIELRSLIKTLLNLNIPLAHHKEIQIQSDLEEVFVFCDRGQIRRVVENLIRNAIKFNFAGATVRVRLFKVQDAAWIYVEDDGPGIPVEDTPKVFQEFGRTSNHPTGGEKSTGLGLSICKRIVERHDGEIDFINLPEKGVRFRVKLPAIQ